MFMPIAFLQYEYRTKRVLLGTLYITLIRLIFVIKFSLFYMYYEYNNIYLMDSLSLSPGLNLGHIFLYYE